jgi:8-oxo-dGTP pyrophosphatase MutT (NUDIX family)
MDQIQKNGITPTRPSSKQPIPPDAEEIFHGRIFDVYQWSQKMFDGTVETFEKLKRPDTVNVIPVLENGNILLSKQSQPSREPFTGTFGGMIDHGETPQEAAARELREETGYESPSYTLIHSVQPVAKIDWAIYTYVARNVKKVGSPILDAGENISIFEVSFDEFVRWAADPTFRDTEISLMVFRAMSKPAGLLELKKTIIGI